MSDSDEKKHGLMAAIRAMHPAVEFAMVLAIVFGIFLFWTIESISSDPSTMQNEYRAETFRASMFEVVVYEVLLAIPAIGILWARGWRPRDLGCKMSWRLTVAGLGIGATGYVLMGVTSLIGSGRGLDHLVDYLLVIATHPGSPDNGIGIIPILLFSAVNPIYEEVFVTGYVISARWNGTVWTGIVASVLLRTSYHAQQGVVAMAGICAMGLLFALIYVRWRQLWPLIVAHAVLDFILLWPLR